MDELPDLSKLTARQRKFTQGIIEGMGDVEAYKHAGYSQTGGPSEVSSKAWKVRQNTHIEPILTAFQLRNAAKMALTAEGHSKQLLDLARKSEEAGQWGAAVRAVELTGKVAGHYVDRVAIERADPVQDALGVMIEEIERTLGTAAADEYARKKGVERLPSTITETLPGEYTEVKDEGVTGD